MGEILSFMSLTPMNEWLHVVVLALSLIQTHRLWNSKLVSELHARVHSMSVITWFDGLRFSKVDG